MISFFLYFLYIFFIYQKYFHSKNNQFFFFTHKKILVIFYILSISKIPQYFFKKKIQKILQSKRKRSSSHNKQSMAFFNLITFPLHQKYSRANIKQRHNPNKNRKNYPIFAILSKIFKHHSKGKIDSHVNNTSNTGYNPL